MFQHFPDTSAAVEDFFCFVVQPCPETRERFEFLELGIRETKVACNRAECGELGGAPDARYAVVTRAERGWSVIDRSVPYDWRSAADAARRNGRPDWERWLQTGRA